MTGAIFCETRPAMIIRSLCRGDGRNTSAPKRAMSNRLAPIDIISIAQQARPKVIGQIELLRIQFTALSRVVMMIPSFGCSPKVARRSCSLLWSEPTRLSKRSVTLDIQNHYTDRSASRGYSRGLHGQRGAIA